MRISNNLKDYAYIPNDYQSILCVFNADKVEKRSFSSIGFYHKGMKERKGIKQGARKLNDTQQTKRIILDELREQNYQLHPVFSSSQDEIVKNSSFDPSTGQVFVPARTSAVFVL